MSKPSRRKRGAPIRTSNASADSRASAKSSTPAANQLATGKLIEIAQRHINPLATTPRLTLQEAGRSLILRRRSVQVFDSNTHLITRSALASTFGGIVTPICLAAFRLITNSNFFGCSTGRSPGLGAFQNLVHIGGSPPPVIKDVCPVAHQTPILDKVSRRVDSRQPILSC